MIFKRKLDTRAQCSEGMTQPEIILSGALGVINDAQGIVKEVTIPLN